VSHRLPHELAEYYNERQWEFGYDTVAYEITADAERIAANRKQRGIQECSEADAEKMIEERNEWLMTMGE